ncbi:hypothetical protein GTO89_11370 [Heliobacterium gestii]|uniref:GGDEF domain-containing protein n=1 Tax=Heliomicrobium gestii TaxID=2699 RepID=A0A845LDL2_HELGE|nr:hypothetical protein [Heliomicrobium gestii]MBM7867375.1 hypothetical protein [Heliomicrobium gestii]MZP43641.1 hypothetical protein [Heliomicrobium gestii]
MNQVYIWAAGLHSVLYYVLIFLPDKPQLLIDLWYGPTLILVGLYSAFQARSLTGASRVTWTLLALGAASYGTGDTIWAFYNAAGIESGKGSLADLFYLGQQVSFVAGLALLLKEQMNRRSAMKFYIDILSITTLVATLMTHFFILPLWNQSELDFTSRCIQVAYPFFDFILIFFTICMGYLWPKHFQGVIACLVAGIWMEIFADLYYLQTTMTQTYESGNMVDPLWGMGMFMVLISLIEVRQEYAQRLYSFERPPAEPLQPLRRIALAFTLTPYGGLILLSLLDILLPDTIVLKLGALLTILMLIFRQLSIMSENDKLLHRAGQLNKALEESVHRQQWLNEELSTMHQGLRVKSYHSDI